METVLKHLLELVTSYGIRIIISIVILFVGLKLVKVLIKRVEKVANKREVDKGLISFILSFCKVLLYVLLFLTIASILGIPLTSFVTVLASAGVAISLALQGALSNFAGGLMILLFKPFKVGDYIETSFGEGTVKNITVIYTVLQTADNKIITLPNGTLTNNSISNYTSGEIRRVDIDISVAYNSDIDKVKNILIECAKSDKLVLKDPKPCVFLVKHGESSLNFTFRAWCESQNYWDVFFNLTEKSKIALDKNNIEIPFNQMDIHIKEK